MVEQFYTITTQVGKAKIANASALGNKVNFTHFALGDGNGGYYNPTENQTVLKKEVWRGAIGQIVVDENNPSWIVLETIIPAEVGGFTIREAGVLDDEGNLLAIGKYPETYKPLLENGSAKDLYIRMILEVANTSVVNLKVDPSIILATKKDIDILSNRIIKNESDISKLEESKASKDYVDQQITLVTETGIPKLSVYEYKFNNINIGTTEIEIPLETFYKATDIVKLFINTVPRDSDFFTIVDTVRDEDGNLLEKGKIVLNEALTDVSKVTVEIWKNIPLGDEGSVSGIVIAPDSMPLNRVQGLSEELQGKVSKTGDKMTGILTMTGQSYLLFQPPFSDGNWIRGMLFRDENGDNISGMGNYGNADNFQYSYIGVGDLPHTTDSNLRFHKDKTLVRKPLEEIFTVISINSQEEFDTLINNVSNNMFNSTHYKRVIGFNVGIPSIGGYGGTWFLEGYKVSSLYECQKLIGYQGGLMYYRVKFTGTWSPWHQIVTNKPIPFIDATLQNGWSSEIQYRRNSIGQLELFINTTAGVVDNNTIVCEIPRSYTPRTNSVIPLQDFTTGNVVTSHFEIINDGATLRIRVKGTTLVTGRRYRNTIVFP